MTCQSIYLFYKIFQIMKHFAKIFCFFLIVQLFSLTLADHHQGAQQKVNKPLTIEEFERHVSEGIPVIDTRHMPENGIIKGAYWVSENGNITQLLSFVLKPHEKFVVVADEPRQKEIAQKLLSGGFKNMLGYNAFNMKEWKEDLTKMAVKRLSEMDKDMKQVFIDVRSKPEVKETGVFPDFLWMPINELTSRLNEVEEYMTKNKDSEIVVHCKASPRARLGASIIMKKGLGPVTVLNERIEMIRDKLEPFHEQSEL